MEDVPKWGALIIYAPREGFVNTVNHNLPRFGTCAEIKILLLYTFHKAVVLVNRIKELRLAKGMKQTELASLLACARTAVSKYELGQLDVSSTTICRLCDIFGCTADYLLGRSDRPDPELTPEEEQLLAAWAAATPEARVAVHAVFAAAAPSQKDAFASAPTA